METRKKSFISLLLSFSLVLSLVSVLLVKPVDAKTVRVAIITALSGDVTVQKGGGSMTYDAYEDMSLNQGDTVYTGDSSSVTLNLANGDADVTLGDNAELNVSDLNTSNGNKKSKLKVWAGSMWVKVKSLAGADDEFEVETPTAVMGVRGTQFYVMVDPTTGKTKMAVGSGRVSASTVTSDANDDQTTTITYVNPTQEISLDSRDETNDLSLKVEFFDLDDFISHASPEIIKELIVNKAEIDKENEEFIAKQQQELAAGGMLNDSTMLSIKDQSDLDKVKQNLENLIGNIAKKAVEENKIDQKSLDLIIAEANSKIDNADKKLDLSKVLPLDKTAGVDPELEKKKQEELKKLEEAKLKSKLEKEKAEAAAKQKLADALKKLEEVKAKVEQAKKEAEAKAKADAEAQLKATLTEQEKKAFDDSKKDTTVVVTPAGPTQSNGNSKPTVKQPAISLTADAVTPTANNATNFNLNINLSYFSGLNDIYGVEVHLLYGSNTNYRVGSELTNKNIFGTATNASTSADYFNPSESGEQRELLYTVTNFGTAGNITVNEMTKLVTIPMQVKGVAHVTVGSLVVVRKNGSAVDKIQVPIENIAVNVGN